MPQQPVCLNALASEWASAHGTNMASAELPRETKWEDVHALLIKREALCERLFEQLVRERDAALHRAAAAQTQPAQQRSAHAKPHEALIDALETARTSEEALMHQATTVRNLTERCLQAEQAAQQSGKLLAAERAAHQATRAALEAHVEGLAPAGAAAAPVKDSSSVVRLAALQSELAALRETCAQQQAKLDTLGRLLRSRRGSKRKEQAL